jgi:hypothetical protein
VVASSSSWLALAVGVLLFPAGGDRAIWRPATTTVRIVVASDAFTGVCAYNILEAGGGGARGGSEEDVVAGGEEGRISEEETRRWWRRWLGSSPPQACAAAGLFCSTMPGPAPVSRGESGERARRRRVPLRITTRYY